MDVVEKERVVKKNVLEIFRDNFETRQSDSEILSIRPEKEYDTDFISYYESILDIFLIDQEHLCNITGKVEYTVKKVAELWSMTPHSFNAYN